MKYEDRTIPEDYCCTVCEAQGVKLWRQYQTCADSIELECCDCAAADQDKNIADIDADGRYTSAVDGERSDQIGWLVPAVPTESESTYWGYTSVPQLGILWWRGLPTKPGDEASGLLGTDMLVLAAKEGLEGIGQISGVAKLICPSVLDMVERFAARAGDNAPQSEDKPNPRLKRFSQISKPTE